MCEIKIGKVCILIFGNLKDLKQKEKLIYQSVKVPCCYFGGSSFWIYEQDEPIAPRVQIFLYSMTAMHIVADIVQRNVVFTTRLLKIQFYLKKRLEKIPVNNIFFKIQILDWNKMQFVFLKILSRSRISVCKASDSSPKLVTSLWWFAVLCQLAQPLRYLSSQPSSQNKFLEQNL